MYSVESRGFNRPTCASRTLTSQRFSILPLVFSPFLRGIFNIGNQLNINRIRPSISSASFQPIPFITSTRSFRSVMSVPPLLLFPPVINRCSFIIRCNSKARAVNSMRLSLISSFFLVIVREIMVRYKSVIEGEEGRVVFLRNISYSLCKKKNRFFRRSCNDEYNNVSSTSFVF